MSDEYASDRPPCSTRTPKVSTGWLTRATVTWNGPISVVPGSDRMRKPSGRPVGYFGTGTEVGRHPVAAPRGPYTGMGGRDPSGAYCRATQ